MLLERRPSTLHWLFANLSKEMFWVLWVRPLTGVRTRWLSVRPLTLVGVRTGSRLLSPGVRDRCCCLLGAGGGGGCCRRRAFSAPRGRGSRSSTWTEGTAPRLWGSNSSIIWNLFFVDINRIRCHCATFFCSSSCTAAPHAAFGLAAGALLRPNKSAFG